MVFVKVRETYDLHTVKNKMTVIGIHTPKPDIIKRNFPGLLMQCKAYRPVSCDVAVSCASVLPLDPLGVGLAEGDVAPEDVFNPILYKAMSNKGMSQLEARINGTFVGTGADVAGNTAVVDVDSTTGLADEFPIYYGLLSNAHDWKHANPQRGVVMTDLKPLVYEMVYNVGDTNSIAGGTTGGSSFAGPTGDGVLGSKFTQNVLGILGKSKPMPFINCTSYSAAVAGGSTTGVTRAGFIASESPENIYNSETDVPYIKVFCGAIVIPPSRLHELFFRMTVVWNIEFSMIRPLSEITNWPDLGNLGTASHFQNYDYSSAKAAITGDSSSELDKDTCMVSSNVDVEKVM